MIKVIGTPNCGACQMAKKILTDRNIEFEYSLLDDIPQNQKDEYLNLSLQNKMRNMPLIFNGKTQLTLQEAMK